MIESRQGTSAGQVVKAAFASLMLVLLLGAIDPARADSTQVSPPAPIGQSAVSAIGWGTPKPVTEISAADVANDDGTAVDLFWTPSADDVAGGFAKKYKVLRAADVDGKHGDFVEVGDVRAGTRTFRDGNCVPGTKYFYAVRTVNDSSVGDRVVFQASSESAIVGPVEPTAQWFDFRRINVLVGVLLLCFFIMWYIRKAQLGEKLFIRRIAGLEAVDEAVGRATEMGRKIYYVPGTSDMDNVQTIAAITILGRVAELAAQYDTWLEVPVSRSLVMVTCREVMKEAYSKVGRPDAYQEAQVHYLTDDQFGYAAAIDGMVVREKPATIFLLGNFYAEALVLAETGNAAGAVQIAGTGEPSQLPFFIAACDYTLIGEELFAASAYLSREPRQLGSLKGQDVGKGLILIAIIIGIILESAHIWELHRLFTVIE